jgi:hypothetical protein
MHVFVFLVLRIYKNESQGNKKEPFRRRLKGSGIDKEYEWRNRSPARFMAVFIIQAEPQWKMQVNW